ncbi:uncharacterized protein RSE6_12234 [Rhynchosporium secalis]|uniref:Uncharacterized protein n=1 Tax=Rhynchosporium secalis TaxID=38038 RepID=A0A1E1MQU5_RHYSE|nr:uncharacterized protein RSE6_12234 [Rhynchosporium secalis]
MPRSISAPTFHLDVVISNAGNSLSDDTENATEEETHKEIETLFFGTARVTTRAIENMRQNGAVIFNTSSLVGVCAFPGHAYYYASIFAVAGSQNLWLGKCIHIGTAGAATDMIELAKLAKKLYTVASRGKCIPLRLPSIDAWRTAKAKFEGLLKDLDDLKNVSAMGQGS